MKPDPLFGAREYHAYGGLILVALGISYMLWGIALVGAALWYMGTFRAGGA